MVMAEPKGDRPRGATSLRDAQLQDGDLSQFRGHPVQLETFQGPLDLLLHLIKKDRIEIWQISISRITQQYLEHLSTLQTLNIEVAGEFLVMAATLMRIKSQNLLPRPSFLPEEEEGEEPLTREGLIARLMEYRAFREAAREMTSMEIRRTHMHPRGVVAGLEPGTRFPLREPKLINLAEYLHELLSGRPEAAGHQVHLEEIRLQDQIDWVCRCLDAPEAFEQLPEAGTVALRFTRLLRRSGLRLEIVVTMLAVLELAKLQRLRVWQQRALDDIWLLARTGSVRERAGEPAEERA